MPSLPSSFLSAPIAHRGFHDAANGVQENSLRAFEEAIKHGFGIELDLQLSSDGEAMVFHDYTLDRLTKESGPIRMKTAAELSDVKLNSCDEMIPTLSDVLKLVNGRALLVIELKDQDGAVGPDVGPLERRVAEVLKTYTGDAVVMSFNPHSVMLLSQIAPNVPRGITTGDYSQQFKLLSRTRAEELNEVPDFESTGSSFVSQDHRLLGAAPVAALKARGVPIMCWTVRSPEQEIKARRLADNITFEGYIPATRLQPEDADV